MYRYFDHTFFAGNRERLQQQYQQDLIVIAASTQVQRSADTAFPFRQDSNFWYLTGIDEPDCFLVISKKETYIIAPQYGSYRVLFEGKTAHQAFSKISGIDQVLEGRVGWQKLRQQLKDHKQVATLLPSKVRQFDLSPNPARSRLIRRLRAAVPACELVDIRLQLARQRMVKQPGEFQAIQKAINITIGTLQEVFDTGLATYKNEAALKTAIEVGFRTRGADGPSFESIVAAGTNTQYLHHFKQSEQISPSDVVLMDVGAEVENYAGDITRVSPYSNLTPRHKEVFEAVAEVQAFAKAGLKPGILVRDNEKRVEEFMGQTLKNLGVITKSSRSAVRRYFPHATSHMMGLDVHDAADYSLPLAENMVLTVEPGIYLPAEGIGVRIEDDIRITKTGHQTLSDNLPVRLG